MDVDDLSPDVASMEHGIHKEADSGAVPRESGQEELISPAALATLIMPLRGGKMGGGSSARVSLALTNLRKAARMSSTE